MTLILLEHAFQGQERGLSTVHLGVSDGIKTDKSFAILSRVQVIR